ncbi:TPA: hypothetical protein N0F65_000765 [Lagenidium giganteum]|uniref:AB hydrolase-1 domain-containing protein n=1 Tax=Lagenidium giganteum TaxID=4803 RepID=A0AAV2ZEM8_9STRA|nr:TPA: hypothetical protein N0F65_000765 [Lagenidium giganteum]
MNMSLLRLLWLALAVVAVVPCHALQINGWFNCTPTRSSLKRYDYELASIEELGKNDTKIMGLINSPPFVECAVALMPLCRPGICDDPQNQTVNVFPRRISALTNSTPPQSIWLTNDGPGVLDRTTCECSARGWIMGCVWVVLTQLSVLCDAVDQQAMALFQNMSGQVSVYTMDLRGSGRSSPLTCLASQVQTSESLGGSQLAVSEIDNCARDLQLQFNSNISGFSLFSAAADLNTLITTIHSEDERVYAYGAGFGSTVMQYLMRSFRPPQVAGYLLDGVFSVVGSATPAPMASRWDDSFSAVAKRFLRLSEDEFTCSTFFGTSRLGINQTLNRLIRHFDEPKTSVCSSFVAQRRILDVWDEIGGYIDYASTDGSTGTEGEPRSYELRRLLGQLLPNPRLRMLIPPLIYRLNRCTAQDLGVLLRFLSVSAAVGLDLNLHDELIIFSENWEQPSPTSSSFQQRLSQSLFACNINRRMVERYCAFTLSRDNACRKYGRSSDAYMPIAYDRDRLANLSFLPANAANKPTAFALVGELDPYTPRESADLFVKATQAASLEAGSAVIPGGSAGVIQFDCGFATIRAFVMSGGNVSAVLEEPCLAAPSKVLLTMSTEATLQILRTTNAYEGVLTLTADADNARRKTSSFRQAFILVCVAFGFSMIVLLLVLFALFDRQRSERTERNERKDTPRRPTRTDRRREPEQSLPMLRRADTVV